MENYCKPFEEILLKEVSFKSFASMLMGGKVRTIANLLYRSERGVIFLQLAY